MFDICWDVVSAIATFLAVLVALFIPFYESLQKNKANNNIINSIRSELDNNVRLIRKKDIEGIKKVNLSVWNEYKYQIISSNPEFYGKCNDIYIDIDRLLRSLFNGSLSRISLMLKYSDILGILNKYNKYFERKLK